MTKPAIFALAFTLMFAALDARAAITVTPQRMELSVPAGGSMAGEFWVVNPDDRPVTVAIESSPWFTTAGNKEYPISSWLSFSSRKLKVRAQDKTRVTFKVRVPKGAHGVLSCVNKFKPAGAEQGMLNLVFSIPIYVIVAGTEKTGAVIGAVDLAARVNTQGAGFMMTTAVSIQNTGNIHIRPQGSVTFYRNGANAGSIELKEGWPVFPEKAEKYLGKDYCVLSEPGSYTALVRIYAGNAFEAEKNIAFTLDKKAQVTISE